VMIEKKHYAFFDCAYQGFATGNLDQDAWAVRYFVERGVPLLICQVCRCIFGRTGGNFAVQSFAKNAGLYGERVGALHVVLANNETVGRVKSQLSVLQRNEISSPPSYGARLVSG
jgi:aspartate aminotransferase